MKIVFHKKFYNSRYANDPAAAPGRIESIIDYLSTKGNAYEFIPPHLATQEDILRAHTQKHFDTIKQNVLLYEMASLSAGGAILSAQEAYNGNPSFAVIRPPGHHASANSCWGFCFFNNMSISLLKLFSEGKIKSAFILDFDLHYGDGNVNILKRTKDTFFVDILNPSTKDAAVYIHEVENHMKKLKNIDIFAASAGFDQGINDWGSLLNADDYLTLGKLMKKYSQRLCKGRRFAIFEGGYYHPDLGKHVHFFCKGFRDTIEDKTSS
jgi:acetoin utilization deacetylase AcuC-like enzyme